MKKYFSLFFAALFVFALTTSVYAQQRWLKKKIEEQEKKVNQLKNTCKNAKKKLDYSQKRLEKLP